MKPSLPWLVLVLVLVAACAGRGGASPGTGGSTSSSPASGGSTATGHTGGSGGTRGSGGAGGGLPADAGGWDGGLPADAGGWDGGSCVTGGPKPRGQCEPDCAAPADCAQPDGPDASHYTCTAGACQYLGCQSAAECQHLVMPAACTTLAGASAPSCQQTCAAPADCVDTTANPMWPIRDASHYACNAGLCVYLGCKSDADCTNSEEPPVCTKLPGDKVPGCYQPCTCQSDCLIPKVQPGWPHCVSGVCDQMGCYADSDCGPTSFSQGVCR